jgi:hypothetical protein
LIEAFISFHLPHISDSKEIEKKYEEFLHDARLRELEKICETHQLDMTKLQKIIKDYNAFDRLPLQDDIAGLFTQKL